MMGKYKYFSEKIQRYETRGIAEEVPLEIRLILWDIIEKRRINGQKLDYLQVFQITSSHDTEKQSALTIHYSQEVPEVSDVYTFTGISCKRKMKIYCIDDGQDYATMLFASEY